MTASPNKLAPRLAGRSSLYTDGLTLLSYFERNYGLAAINECATQRANSLVSQYEKRPSGGYA